MIFDSHAHYDSRQFDDDREELLARVLPSCGVKRIVNCGSDLPSSEFSLQLAEEYDYIYAAVGIHPHEAEKLPADAQQQLVALFAHPKCVAVGEIGLDYHYDFSPRDIQKLWFEKQIELARQHSLPVIVHDREAHADTLDLLQLHKPAGVIHCFSGSLEMAKEVLDLGLYIGLGGAVTFKNAKTPVAVAAYVPLDRLLLETDCPYMTPVPYRGQRCDSSMIALTAKRIAEIKGISEESVLTAAAENASCLFGIPLE